MAGAIIPLYRRVEAASSPTIPTYFSQQADVLFARVKSTPPAAHTGLGLRSPVSCRPTWLKPSRPSKPSHAHGRRRRRAFALPSYNLLTGEATICLGRGPSGSRLFKCRRVREGGLGCFWTLGNQTDNLHRPASDLHVVLGIYSHFAFARRALNRPPVIKPKCHCRASAWALARR